MSTLVAIPPRLLDSADSVFGAWRAERRAGTAPSIGAVWPGVTIAPA
ncbi:MAG: hypothetical protein ACUVSX_00320 [Aggregatilineales bacterium]